jgi:hypothetical protein
MRNQMILASVAMALLGACVGGIDTPPIGGEPPTSQEARKMFDQVVVPLLQTKCQSCHVGPTESATNMFLGPDGLSSFYPTLIADRAVNGGFNPEAATLLLKGAHDGPAWTASEADKIAKWLSAELAARGPELPPDTDPTAPNNRSARGASMAFVACMKEADYTQLAAYQIANMNTDRGRCYSCHSPGGAGGEWLGIQNQYKDMFEKWHEEIFFTGVFQAQIQTDRTYKIAAAENKICAKGTEKDRSAGTHPEFDCRQNNSLALNNLKAFATKVQGMVEARDPTCVTPAAFAPPTP